MQAYKSIFSEKKKKDTDEKEDKSLKKKKSKKKKLKEDTDKKTIVAHAQAIKEFAEEIISTDDDEYRMQMIDELIDEADELRDLIEEIPDGEENEE